MTAFIIALCLVFIGTLSVGFLFVCLVWTHRPNLSVIDIGREMLIEIKNYLRAGRKPAERKSK